MRYFANRQNGSIPAVTAKVLSNNLAEFVALEVCVGVYNVNDFYKTWKWSINSEVFKNAKLKQLKPTLRASSLVCRLFIRLFQSSLVFATLALIPSTLSLDTTAIRSSPLAPTVLSLAWPFSLSLRNSWGEAQTKTKELWWFNTNTHKSRLAWKGEDKKTDCMKNSFVPSAPYCICLTLQCAKH